MIRRFSRQLASSYYVAKDYKKSYDYYVVFVAKLEESLKQERAKAIAETSAKYQYEKQEQKLDLLAEQKELEDRLHEEEIAKQKAIIGYSVFAALLLLFAAIYIYRSQKNKQHAQFKLKEQEKELVRQNAILAGQEAERNRLSQELHDGLGGSLASIKLRLTNQNDSENAQEALAPILIDLDKACQEVRNVSHSLSSSFVLATDFYSLLKKYAKDLGDQSGMKVYFDFLPKEKLNTLSEETRHNCFRIIQELGTNTLKHANASSFTLGLLLDDETVHLQIEDDGDGVDQTHEKLSGIGLLNVRDRVQILKGEIQIESAPNKGMIISINFPFLA